MEYQFRCDKCNKTYDLEISMKDYDKLKDKQICPECNGHLQRVLEWEGPACNLGGYSDVAGMAKWQTK